MSTTTDNYYRFKHRDERREAGSTTGRIMAAFLSDDGAVMRSTQYYGQTRRFQVVGVTPKSVSVREIYQRWAGYRRRESWLVTHGDVMTKRVREDGTFSLGRWQCAGLESPERLAAGDYPTDFHW